MNQVNVFPKRLTAFAIFFLILVLSFGLYTLGKTSQLLSSFSSKDVPALQLSCAATRVMGETVMAMNDPEKNKTQIDIQVQVLDDSLQEILALTSDYPELSKSLTSTANYQNFIKLVNKEDLNGRTQGVLTDLKGDVQNLVESYLFKKNEQVQSNIRFGYFSAIVSLLGVILFFVLIFFIYLSYQRNVDKLNELTKNLEKERLTSMQSSKLASLGEMAAGLAHEINNPLSVIIGRSEMLMTEMAEGPVTDIEITKTITKISEMSGRISKIVSSMRKIAKSTGQTELSNQNLFGIVEDVLNLSQERLRNSSIELSSDEIDRQIVVHANFTQLSQVLINLINNCVDELSKKPDGQRNIWLKSEKQDNYVLLKVIDSGPGVPEEYKQKLFEPFFTTKDVGKGTGLGLSISKTLMTEMGGDLFLTTDAGRTAFVMKLAIAKS